ncbi:hypothetical protein D3C80_1502860 [compost metagenome]
MITSASADMAYHQACLPAVRLLVRRNSSCNRLLMLLAMITITDRMSSTTSRAMPPCRPGVVRDGPRLRLTAIVRSLAAGPDKELTTMKGAVIFHDGRGKMTINYHFQPSGRRPR